MLTNMFPILPRVVDFLYNDADILSNEVFADASFQQYNIIKKSETELLLEVSLPGFSKEDIEVSVEQNKLTVKGKRTEEHNLNQYVKRGIGIREFYKQWSLPQHVEAKEVKYINGLLQIALELQIPEHQKRKLLDIH